LNKLLHNLVQNFNTLQKNLPTSQYELGIKCPHAEGLKTINILIGIVLTLLYFMVELLQAKGNHVSTFFKYDKYRLNINCEALK
jgi:hypothetical protein